MASNFVILSDKARASLVHFSCLSTWVMLLQAIDETDSQNELASSSMPKQTELELAGLVFVLVGSGVGGEVCVWSMTGIVPNFL